MIAEIYPILRMPRKFGVFDYELPDGMCASAGSFVRIPFRSGEVVGVVARTKDGGERGIRLKRVTAVLSDVPSLSPTELAVYVDVARDTAQSVSAILHAAIPKFSTRALREPVRCESLPLTIPAREAPALSLAASQLGQRAKAFVYAPDLRRSTVLVAAYLREHPNEPILVLVPNVRDARLVAERLGASNPFVVTGEESPPERARTWMAWKRCETGILVATRTGALWTHPALGAIFLLRSGHSNHKQDDRNPRFDVRAVADILHERLHARLAFVDVAPTVEALVGVGGGDLLGPSARPDSYVADMTVERFGAPHPCIGQSAALRITEALSERKRVLCVYNLKGVSRRLQCSDCGHRFPCTSCGGVFAPYGQTVRCHRCGRVEPMPLNCPSCGGNKLSPRGYGNRSVASAMQKLFPEATVRCMEKGSEEVVDAPDIVIVTRHYLENVFDPFRPEAFGLVVELDADLPLYEPSTFALERSVVNAEEWRGVANACHADILFQTETPELLREILSKPERVIAEDASNRRVYGQPPYCRTIDVTYRSNEPHESAHAMRAMAELIRQSARGATIAESAERLRVTVPTADVATLLAVFSRADDRYIIDTRPLG